MVVGAGFVPAPFTKINRPQLDLFSRDKALGDVNGPEHTESVCLGQKHCYHAFSLTQVAATK